MTAPVLPIRRVHAYMHPMRPLWIPCAESESRASLIVDVDANGRSVVAVYGAPFDGMRIVGWKFAEGDEMLAPEKFKKWLEANPKLEIVK